MACSQPCRSMSLEAAVAACTMSVILLPSAFLCARRALHMEQQQEQQLEHGEHIGVSVELQDSASSLSNIMLQAQGRQLFMFPASCKAPKVRRSSCNHRQQHDGQARP